MSPTIYFKITGPPGSGKSKIIKRVEVFLDSLGLQLEVTGEAYERENSKVAGETFHQVTWIWTPKPL